MIKAKPLSFCVYAASVIPVTLLLLIRYPSHDSGSGFPLSRRGPEYYGVYTLEVDLAKTKRTLGVARIIEANTARFGFAGSASFFLDLRAGSMKSFVQLKDLQAQIKAFKHGG